MPTKKKRVGFIPRENVMKLIDKLSLENNLSNSKIISILVEEALSIRGIFNNKTGELTQSYQRNKNFSESLSENIMDSIDIEKFTINTNLANDKKLGNTKNFKEISQDAFDLQTYRKFLLFLKFQEMVDECND